MKLFRHKIALALAGLVLVTTIVTTIAALSAIHSDSLASIHKQLELGSQVFSQALRSRTSLLTDSVDILTNDFGFKQAIATGDANTIESMLVNHGARIDADAVILLSTDAQVLMNTMSDGSASELQRFPYSSELLDQQSTSAQAATIPINGSAYLFVVAPIKAPTLIAWACVGFKLDEKFIAELKSISQLEISLLQDIKGEMSLVTTTHSDDNKTQLPAKIAKVFLTDSLSGAATNNTVNVGGNDYMSMVKPLATTKVNHVYALLQLSITDGLKAFYELRKELISWSLIALLIAIAVSLLLAKSVTRPLSQLVDAAKRIGRGDYQHPVDLNTRDELADLGRTLNSVQADIHQREQHIVYQSQHDTLTGLKNRLVVNEVINDQIQIAQSEQQGLSVVIIDLNRFKEINSSLGHELGDKVIEAVAERLVGKCSDNESVVRLGGDEFLVCMKQDDLILSPAQADKLTDSLLDVLRHPYELGDLTINVNFTLGIGVFPDHGVDPLTLLRCADIALNTAKDNGMTYSVYESGEEAQRLRRITMMRELGTSIQEGKLKLVYQPKVSCSTGEVTAVEALVRWTHPEFGFVSPEEFIPLAEHAGYITQLTHRVLTDAIAQASVWQNSGIHVTMAVNLSAIDLLDQTLPHFVGQLLNQYQLDGSQLCLEVTESAVMHEVSVAVRTLAEFSAYGITLSIDDFGTGHSSLAQLKQLPVDELKIDKSFVQQLHEDATDVAIVKSTIELAHTMGLKVTAEGVETLASLQILDHHLCDRVQGYLFSKPLPPDQFADWYHQHDPSQYVELQRDIA